MSGGLSVDLFRYDVFVGVMVVLDVILMGVVDGVLGVHFVRGCCHILRIHLRITSPRSSRHSSLVSILASAF